MGGMNMKSRHSLGNLVTAVIAKIINHLEVCFGNRSIGTQLLRLVGSTSLQAVQEVGAYRNSNTSVKLTPTRCVLRMDHHCPWLDNCVGHYNYANFIRFLWLVDIACSYHLIMVSLRIWDAVNVRRWVCDAMFQHAYNLTDSFVYFVGPCSDRSNLHLLELCCVYSCPRGRWYL